MNFVRSRRPNEWPDEPMWIYMLFEVHGATNVEAKIAKSKGIDKTLLDSD